LTYRALYCRDVPQVPWDKLAGVRLKRSKMIAASREHYFEIVSLAVIIEPLRLLHQRFIYIGSMSYNDKSWPHILDELHGGLSYVVAVLQYYSTFLAGKSTRFRLIWMLSGSITVERWIQKINRARHYSQ